MSGQCAHEDVQVLRWCRHDPTRQHENTPNTTTRPTPKHANTRSQDLREAYHDAGQFYWGRRDAFMDCDNMFAAKSAPVSLPRNQVQDIDTPEDWDCAEQLYHLQSK